MSIPSREVVQSAVDYVAEQSRKVGGVFIQEVFNGLKVDSVALNSDQIPTVVFKVFSIKMLLNSANMVHGGATSTILALCSQLALAADSKYWAGSTPTADELAAFAANTGTTRSLDIQIIQAVPLEAELSIKCQVISSTKSNAFVSVEIFNPSGRLVVMGVHDIMKQRHPAYLDPKDRFVLKAHLNRARL